MRVITGTARGRRLLEPDNYDIRPTTDKVKESMFNIVQFSVEGARVLDLFAGTGQLGIEALSRGAAECTFVDRSPEAVRIIGKNLTSTGLATKARVLRQDSLTYLETREKYDIVLLDPPYALDLLEKAINQIYLFDILNKDGIMICESERGKELPDLPRDEYTRREYGYGRIKLTIYTKGTGT